MGIGGGAMTVFRVLLIVLFVAAGAYEGGGEAMAVGLLVGLAFAFADKLFIGDDKGCAMWIPSLLIIAVLALVGLRLGGGL
jgi:hypothetical protein